MGLKLMDNLAKIVNIVKDDYQGKTFEGKRARLLWEIQML